MSSSQNPYPQLTRYIVVYGNDVEMENTLGAALADVFGAATSNIGTGTANIPAQVRALIESAQSYYNQGLAALRSEDLTAYSADMKVVGSLIAEAQADLAKDQKPVASTAIRVTRSPA